MERTEVPILCTVKNNLALRNRDHIGEVTLLVRRPYYTEVPLYKWQCLI